MFKDCNHISRSLLHDQPTDATMGVRSYFQKIKRRRAYGYNKKSKFNSSSFSGVGSTKSALSGFGRKRHVDLQRRDIDKVVKEATSKHLSRPDTGLNQKVREMCCTYKPDIFFKGGTGEVAKGSSATVRSSRQSLLFAKFAK